jgi:hypothetical protein
MTSGADEMRHAPAVRGLPVTVLTAGKNPPLPENEIRAIGPDACHIVARMSGHWIHFDEPELVVNAVRELVDAARQAQLRAISG